MGAEYVEDALRVIDGLAEGEAESEFGMTDGIMGIVADLRLVSAEAQRVAHAAKRAVGWGPQASLLSQSVHIPVKPSELAHTTRTRNVPLGS